MVNWEESQDAMTFLYFHFAHNTHPSSSCIVNVILWPTVKYFFTQGALLIHFVRSIWARTIYSARNYENLCGELKRNFVKCFDGFDI